MRPIVRGLHHWRTYEEDCVCVSSEVRALSYQVQSPQEQKSKRKKQKLLRAQVKGFPRNYPSWDSGDLKVSFDGTKSWICWRQKWSCVNTIQFKFIQRVESLRHLESTQPKKEKTRDEITDYGLAEAWETYMRHSMGTTRSKHQILMITTQKKS